MKTLKLVLSIVLLLIFNGINAQTNFTQIIKGTVVDKESQLPLPGATILVETVNPPLGSTTDANGNFRLEKVPLGRHTIRVSFMGYEPYVLRELLISSGKETVLNIELKESSIQIKEVVITANSNKDKPINAMATLSARQLSVEEANRYAGGFDDPARLASVFAGVAGNLQTNGIVVRGNAPKGMLWQMEGVEISTPTHFANITTFGGGGITALSSQMLANSDFYTGAFPAEYGNALSGVFDLKLRTGNNERKEFTIQAGLIGIDFSAEGPFVKGKKASFVFNYRYSTFSLISPLLPEDAGGIRYQDLCFKLNFPTQKAGTFAIWGIGALDVSPQKAESDSTLWVYDQDKEQGKNNLGMGAIGLSHKIIAGKKSFIFSSLTLSGNTLDHSQSRYNPELTLQPLEIVKYDNWKYSFSTYLNYKFSARHTNRAGFTADNLNYNYDIENTEIPGQPLVQVVKEKAQSNLLAAYSESRIDLSQAITMNVGLHSQYFSENGQYTLEPRLGLTWKYAPNHSFSIGYGNHSQLEMLQIYRARKQHGNGYTEPNKNLGFSRAHHLVLGYDWKINENLHLRIEPYYQYLYHIPVAPDSSFSLINLDKNWFINDSLVNKGTGVNKGIDITLERFLQQGYYYLVTASIFDSKYKGGDGIEHNTRYNKHFVFNLLGGKEWTLNNKNLLSVSGKLTFMGGDRISPLDEKASLVKKEAVYDETRA
ncbi:MAG TPA: TonB-dependent receptor, partial [Bacteroidales bacterium]